MLPGLTFDAGAHSRRRLVQGSQGTLLLPFQALTSPQACACRAWATEPPVRYACDASRAIRGFDYMIYCRLYTIASAASTSRGGGGGMRHARQLYLRPPMAFFTPRRRECWLSRCQAAFRRHFLPAGRHRHGGWNEAPRLGRKVVLEAPAPCTMRQGSPLHHFLRHSLPLAFRAERARQSRYAGRREGFERHAKMPSTLAQ